MVDPSVLFAVIARSGNTGMPLQSFVDAFGENVSAAERRRALAGRLAMDVSILTKQEVCDI